MTSIDAPYHLSTPRRPFAARGFDMLLTLTALFALWPILVVSALAFAVPSPDPVFFIQTRMDLGSGPSE